MQRFERGSEALKAAGLGNRMEHTRLSHPAVSNGASLSRALVNQPSFLLADEPTGARSPERTYQPIAVLAVLLSFAPNISAINNPGVAASMTSFLSVRSQSKRTRCAAINKLAIESLAANKLRTVLTMLGVIFGVVYGQYPAWRASLLSSVEALRYG